MDVVDGLAGVRAHVEDQPVATAGHPPVRRHRVGSFEETGQQPVLRGFAGVGKVFARHHQDVDRGSGLDVLKGDDLVVLEDHLGRRPAGRYLAEDADCHSPSEVTSPEAPRPGPGSIDPFRYTTRSSCPARRPSRAAVTWM
jgi:hypothetical protein